VIAITLFKKDCIIKLNSEPGTVVLGAGKNQTFKVPIWHKETPFDSQKVLDISGS